MSPDDVVYCILLILSVAFGHVVKQIEGAKQKQIVSTAAGVLIVVFVCGIHGLHPLVTAVVNGLLVLYLDPRICHLVSFAWCFGYIAFFRTCHYFGFPKVAPHANAVQLLLTLKMVGLAFEIHDTYKNKKAKVTDEASKEKLALRSQYQDIHPGMMDILCYSFCYIGLLTGPYYKYRTYYDMLHHTNTKNIDTIVPLYRRLKVLPIYAMCFLVASYFFSIQNVREDAFFEHPFWYRQLYMVPMFFIFRMRFYVGWILSECMCFTSTLGAYPVATKPRCGTGPTNLEGFKLSESQAPEGIAYNFETVHNIDEYGCEFAPTVREGMRSWNMTVQYWLASNVYKRLTIKSGPARVAITMTVSAFWHGIHPGYYLAFLFVPVNLVAEDLMIAAFRNDTSPRQQVIFDWLCWFCKMRSFDYMCMGFLLLTLHDTLRYWSSIYFSGHIFLVIFICIGLKFKPKRRKRDTVDGGAGDAAKKIRETAQGVKED